MKRKQKKKTRGMGQRRRRRRKKKKMTKRSDLVGTRPAHKKSDYF